MPTIYPGGELSPDEAIDRLAATFMNFPDPLNTSVTTAQLRDLADNARVANEYIARHSRCNFQCVYVRPNGDRFQLVAQWVNCIGDDFTFDEEVLATADTPQGLPLFSIGRDFVMPPHPSMR